MALLITSLSPIRAPFLLVCRSSNPSRDFADPKAGAYTSIVSRFGVTKNQLLTRIARIEKFDSDCLDCKN